MLQQFEAVLQRLGWLQGIDLSNGQLWLIAGGLLLILLALLRMLRRRRLRAGILLLFVGLFLSLGGMLYAIGQHQFSSYRPLLPEREILQIRFLPPKDRQSGGTRIQMLPRDEAAKGGIWAFDAEYWQISARVIRWRGRSWYRWRWLLRTDSQEADQTRRAYRLMRTRSPDLWERVHDYLDWVPGLDAEHLTSDPAPAAAGAAYRVALLPYAVQVTPAADAPAPQVDSGR